MSDERPETCVTCGAPIVWCACAVNPEGDASYWRVRAEQAESDNGRYLFRIKELTEYSNKFYAERDAAIARAERAEEKCGILVKTLGYVYLAISRIAANPPGDDTGTLVEIMTTIEKATEKGGS